MSYYAAISWCDDNFGRLLCELEQEGLSDNTIVIFTSDHGDMLGSHGIFNEKTYWYEEAIGIPFSDSLARQDSLRRKQYVVPGA